MARALRIQFAGAIYHVTARGNERRAIFRDDADRVRYLALLAEHAKAAHVRVYAYVLMSNHVHLLLQTPRANLSSFMQQLQGAYSIHYNRRHRRVGHLFGGRFKARLVEGDAYLRRLTRYVHLNPVMIRSARSLTMSERIDLLRAYRWSSYRGYAGLAAPEAWLDYGPLAAAIGEGHVDQATAYRSFVEAGLAETDEDLREALDRSSKAIGAAPYCRWAEDAYRALAQQQRQPIDVAMRRMETPLDASRILDAICGHFGLDRAALRQRRGMAEGRLLAMWLLRTEAGLSQREIARELGLRDGSGISRHLERIAAKADAPEFRRTCETVLGKVRANH